VLSTASPRSPIVLLVDDDADTLDMYEIGLTAVGFRPLTTRDGSSVSRQVDAVCPDVVVTDLQLQGTSGWVVVESLRRNAKGRTIPVVLLTGSSSPQIDRQAQELGCAAVVMKPCTPDELGEVLRQVLTTS